jgi:hypothetical protein
MDLMATAPLPLRASGSNSVSHHLEEETGAAQKPISAQFPYALSEPCLEPGSFDDVTVKHKCDTEALEDLGEHFAQVLKPLHPHSTAWSLNAEHTVLVDNTAVEGPQTAFTGPPLVDDILVWSSLSLREKKMLFWERRKAANIRQFGEPYPVRVEYKNVNRSEAAANRKRDECGKFNKSKHRSRFE